MSQHRNTRTEPAPSSPTSDSCAARELKITTWRLGMPKAAFYVQAKGNHAGRPLRSPIPNCWAVYSPVEHLYEIAFSIYKSCSLEPLIRGSVIPFLALGEYQPILRKAAMRHREYNPDLLRTLGMLDEQINNMRRQASLLREYQRLLALKINSQLNII